MLDAILEENHLKKDFEVNSGSLRQVVSSLYWLFAFTQKSIALKVAFFM